MLCCVRLKSGPDQKSMDLYWLEPSPGSRAALMTAKALGLEPELKRINPFLGENHTPQYLKINPLGKIPTLVDGDTVIFESRAIITYLADKYSTSNKVFYPSALGRRSKVNSLLNYDIGTFYTDIIGWLGPQVFQGKAPDDEKEEAMKKTISQFEQVLLGDQQFLTGDAVCVADISFAASITSLELLGYDLAPWPRLSAWLARIKQQPWYGPGNQGYEEYKQQAAAKASENGETG